MNIFWNYSWEDNIFFISARYLDGDLPKYLLNALVTSITEKSTNGHESRDIKKFCKNIGINIYNKYPFALKNGENHEKSYNILYNRELREISQKNTTFM